MSYRSLRYHEENRIGHISLDSPPGNPMSLSLFQELDDILEHRLDAEKVDGVILASSGRHFSYGAQIHELKKEVWDTKGRNIPIQMRKNALAFARLRTFPKPVVALINGVCYGSGFELALCARYRIATPRAIFALPETGFGLMPGLGGIHALVHLCGKAMAIKLALSGQSLDANEALNLNLIHMICDKNQLQESGKNLIQSTFNMKF